MPGLTAPLLVDNGKPDFTHTVYNEDRWTSLSGHLSLTATICQWSTLTANGLAAFLSSFLLTPYKCLDGIAVNHFLV